MFYMCFHMQYKTMIAWNIYSILNISVLYKIVALLFMQKADFPFFFSSQGEIDCIHLSGKHDLILQHGSGKECGISLIFFLFLSLNNCEEKKLKSMHLPQTIKLHPTNSLLFLSLMVFPTTNKRASQQSYLQSLSISKKRRHRSPALMDWLLYFQGLAIVVLLAQVRSWCH